MYEYIDMINISNNLSDNTSAAFPINKSGDKICCVLGKNIIKSKYSMIYLFHEFVHCYQYENYEIIIKKDLNLDDDKIFYLMNNFKYNNIYFYEYYQQALMYLKQNNIKESIKIKQKLFGKLTLDKIKFITFLEWKEGYARFYENFIRENLNIKKNNYYNHPVLDTTIIYEYGSEYFRQTCTSIETDLYHGYKRLSKDYLELN